MSIKISLVIITKNEEKNIEECILSAKDIVDEIIVIDDFSTDNTTQIASRLGAKIFKRRLDNFCNQKNFALKKVRNEWVLFLDADERLSSQLKNEIVKAVSYEYDGFRILRRNYIFGKLLKYGANAEDWVVRLFKRSKGVFVNPIHEYVVVKGKLKDINKGFIIHYSTKDLHSYIEKLNLYTDLEKDIVKHKAFLLLRLIVHPPLIFIRDYFLRLGILDGWEGFLFCVLSSFYAFVKYAKSLLP